MVNLPEQKSTGFDQQISEASNRKTLGFLLSPSIPVADHKPPFRTYCLSKTTEYCFLIAVKPALGNNHAQICNFSHRGTL